MIGSSSPNLLIETLLGEVPVAAFVVDSSGNGQHTNVHWKQYLCGGVGLEATDHWHSIFTGGTEPAALLAKARAQNHTVWETVSRVGVAAGTQEFLVVGVRALREPDGDVLGYFGVAGPSVGPLERALGGRCRPRVASGSLRRGRLIGSLTQALRMKCDLERRVLQQAALAELGYRALMPVGPSDHREREALFLGALEQVCRLTPAKGAAAIEIPEDGSPTPQWMIIGVPRTALEQELRRIAAHQASAVGTQGKDASAGAERPFLDVWSSAARATFAAISAGTEVTVPLTSSRSSLGALNTYWHSDRPPGESDIEFIRAVAKILAGAVSQMRDTSARYHAEQQRLQEEKTDAIGRLAGGVAHDFNNLLGIVLGYAEAVAETLPFGDPNREDLGSVIAAAHRGKVLTGQLLNVSRQQLVRPQLISLGDLVQSRKERLVREMGPLVQLDLRVEDSAWRMRIDPAQAELALFELAANARNAMPAGGQLTVELKLQQIINHSEACCSRGSMPVASCGPYLVLAVEDTGDGISSQARLHLFQPIFNRIPSRTGLGLGLAAVHGIVRQAGGHIGYHTVQGHGTRFELSFPAVPSPARSAEPTPVSTVGAPNGTNTILLVEDDIALREILERMLRRAGYPVIVASSALHALHLVTKQHVAIGLLLTDVMMPDLNGRELAKQVAAVAPEVGVLYISGYSQDILTDQGILAQGIRLLHKPFTEGELRSTLDRVFAEPQRAVS